MANFNGSDPDEIQVGNHAGLGMLHRSHEVYNGNTGGGPHGPDVLRGDCRRHASNCYETGSDNPNSSGGCLMSIDVNRGRRGVTDAFPTGARGIARRNRAD